MTAPQTKPREVKIRVHDGVEIAVALYMPKGNGPFPVLLAASPYRYDNNTLPATPQFLWRETGPIDFYVERGFAYAHMDLRGCGKSGGEFRLGTDDPTYCHWSMMIMNGRADFEWQARPPADFLTRPADWPETRYERKARRQGHEVWYFRYIRR